MLQKGHNLKSQAIKQLLSVWLSAFGQSRWSRDLCKIGAISTKRQVTDLKAFGNALYILLS